MNETLQSIINGIVLGAIGGIIGVLLSMAFIRWREKRELEASERRIAEHGLSLRDQIRQTASDAVERLRVRSALNPILWLCFIVVGPALFYASRQPVVPMWLIVLIFAPVGVGCFGFLFLLFFDRDKLQSEDYQS